ncbi:MAG: imidazole glycerol phosphate synthase subunit HisH [Oscillibacter sp.]|nr:imidazole glycerol phosphate synthase subunit HisH [Oscillibacter sp.]
MIAIVDYGVGNLFSLSSSLRHLGLETEVTGDAERLRAAERIILPGVGAFGDAMEKLTATGLVPVLREEAERKPLLGICLGMQLLFERSFEYGEHPGLGLIGGEVADLRADLADKTLKVPHMGWNSLELLRDDPLFRYVKGGEYVYYVHSFYAKNCAESTLAVSRYDNVAVTGVVRRGRVYGTQFHPEKSGDVGLRLLRAFAEV